MRIVVANRSHHATRSSGRQCWDRTWHHPVGCQRRRILTPPASRGTLPMWSAKHLPCIHLWPCMPIRSFDRRHSSPKRCLNPESPPWQLLLHSAASRLNLLLTYSEIGGETFPKSHRSDSTFTVQTLRHRNMLCSVHRCTGHRMWHHLMRSQ